MFERSVKLVTRTIAGMCKIALGLLATVRGPWEWSHTGWAKAGFFFAALFAYYGIGGWWIEEIDTNPGLTALPVGAHQSRAISVAAVLTHREVDRHRWTPADPFFLPGWALTAMPNFQQGVIGVIGRFAETYAMADGANDSDLAQAAGLFKYPPTVWRLAAGISWLPTAPSDRQYRHAAQALEAYNDHMGREPEDNPRSAAILSALLAEVDQDLDGVSARLDAHLESHPWALIDGPGTRAFHNNRGRFYAWSVILRELGQDNQQLLADKGLTAQWRRLTDALMVAARFNPPAVLSGGSDGSLLPNHLLEQGYFLLKASDLIDEIGQRLKS